MRLDRELLMVTCMKHSKLFVLALASACGGEQVDVAATEAALLTDNGYLISGLSTTMVTQPTTTYTDAKLTSSFDRYAGISPNGYLTNGLSSDASLSNGLAQNGLSQAALGTSQFAAWFDTDLVFSNMVMKYLVRCALPLTMSRTHVDGVIGYSFEWSGTLGLAPAWASGLPIPQSEQELVSACLAAHANKYGVNVSVSVRGYRGDGSPIRPSKEEARDYGFREGAFFGNLFQGAETVYACFDQPYRDAGFTSARACAFDRSDRPGDCPPMVHAGLCSAVCANRNEGLGAYATCNGYRALTTRLRDADIIW